MRRVVHHQILFVFVDLILQNLNAIFQRQHVWYFLQHGSRVQSLLFQIVQEDFDFYLLNNPEFGHVASETALIVFRIEHKQKLMKNAEEFIRVQRLEINEFV
jgi:hypothetical protein